MRPKTFFDMVRKPSSMDFSHFWAPVGASVFDEKPAYATGFGGGL
jgi:hypothetical protein